MEPVFIFNSTVLVLWAVMFIPWALSENKRWMIVVTGMVLFVVELNFMWDRHEHPWHIINSLLIVLFAFAGGLVQYYFNQRHKEKENERAKQ